MTVGDGAVNVNDGPLDLTRALWEFNDGGILTGTDPDKVHPRNGICGLFGRGNNIITRHVVLDRAM